MHDAAYGVALLSHAKRAGSMPVDLASADLPHEPGVYLFKNEQGRVLYVGKATRLNERIRSYFASNPDVASNPGNDELANSKKQSRQNFTCQATSQG